MAKDSNAGFKYTRKKDVSLEDTFTEKKKRDKNDFKSITFFIDEEMHTNFKTHCTQKKVTMTDVLTESIRKLLEKP